MSLRLQAQPLAVLQPNNSCDFRELLLTPIGLCGHAWTWMKDVQWNTTYANIAAIALRTVALPFFAGATVISAALGVVGALMTPSTRSVNLDHPVGDMALLQRDIPNENVAAEVKLVLEQQGCACDVAVASGQFRSSDAYYAQYVSRTITLTSEDSTMSKIYQVIKNRFYHAPSLDLSDLHLSLMIRATSQEAVVDQVKRALVEHGRVSFELAFDLAVGQTTVG